MTHDEYWWKCQHDYIKQLAQELVNKIHYSNDLHAIFNIKDCEEYKNLKERLEKIKST